MRASCEQEWSRVQRAPADKQPLIRMRATHLEKVKTSLKGKGFSLSRQIQERELSSILSAPVPGHIITQQGTTFLNPSGFI